MNKNHTQEGLSSSSLGETQKPRREAVSFQLSVKHLHGRKLENGETPEISEPHSEEKDQPQELVHSDKQSGLDHFKRAQDLQEMSDSVIQSV